LRRIGGDAPSTWESWSSIRYFNTIAIPDSGGIYHPDAYTIIHSITNDCVCNPQPDSDVYSNWNNYQYTDDHSNTNHYAYTNSFQYALHPTHIHHYSTTYDYLYSHAILNIYEYSIAYRNDHNDAFCNEYPFHRARSDHRTIPTN
jgi:hypothetical protein